MGTVIDIHQIYNDLQKRFIEFSNEGYRVLGLAFRNGDKISSLAPEHEKQMTFLGFWVFWDPIKKDIFNTIEGLEKLGVKLKIITGDNKLVAMHVAKLLGISEKKVLTGSQLHQMSDRALFHQVGQKSIFAEIEPIKKKELSWP